MTKTTVDLNIPHSAAARVGANEYVKTFQRNCPNVRMTEDEREELWRLFNIALTPHYQAAEQER